MAQSGSHRIVIVGSAGMQSLDAVGPFDVFSGADPAVGSTVKVDPDPVFVRDGDVWTSAHETIDLALALVVDDHGVDVTAPDGDRRLPVPAAAMRLRHFSRVFADEVGVTPGRYVERAAPRRDPRRVPAPFRVESRDPFTSPTPPPSHARKAAQ